MDTGLGLALPGEGQRPDFVAALSQRRSEVDILGGEILVDEQDPHGVLAAEGLK